MLSPKSGMTEGVSNNVTASNNKIVLNQAF